MSRAAQTIFSLILGFSLLVSTAATAADWPNLPAACLPSRAQPAGTNATCHCPPASLCPQNYEEYSNPSLARMPPKFIYGLDGTARCCPIINPPACPSGTLLEGQPVPPDGNCNPVCPAGTTLAGQAIPPDGNCNPAAPPPQCPAKYYPSLSESGLANLQNLGQPKDPRKGRDNRKVTIGTYQAPDGSTHTVTSGGADYAYGVVGRTPTYYDYSLRIFNFSGMYGWYWIGDASYFSTLTEGASPPAGNKTFYQIKNEVGADNLTWFGFFIAKPSRLPNNLLSEAELQAWGSRDRIEIGGWNPYSGYVSMYYNVPPSLQSLPIITECNRANGEYVALERINVNGAQCAYLQCRYIYSAGSNESCLSGDTKITMADGSLKPITEVKLGELVKGSEGTHKVTAANAYQSALRVMYGINGGSALLTGDHPLRTKDGWKVIDAEAAKLHAGKAGFADSILKVGDVLITDKGEVAVTAIQRFPQVEPTTTYNIRVDGNAGFYANGYEVKGFGKMEMHYQ